MKITLDPTVLKAVKAAAAPYVPGCRSSHLSEALAAGFGYRTSISLQTAMRAGASVEAIVNDADARARLDGLGAPAPTVPDFLTRAVAEARPMAPPATEGALLLRMPQGEMVLSRDGLRGPDGQRAELRHQGDFASFLSATADRTTWVMGRVFAAQETHGGSLPGYGPSANEGIRVCYWRKPTATRWAVFVQEHFARVVEGREGGVGRERRRAEAGRLLVAMAFAAYAAATALKMDDVLDSEDFLPIRYLIEKGGWKAAFATEEAWGRYMSLTEVAEGGTGRVPSASATAAAWAANERLDPSFRGWDESLREIGARDPRDDARMPTLPWIGRIHDGIDAADSPLLTALMFGSNLRVEGDGTATVRIHGIRDFHMRVEETEEGQFSALTRRVDARLAEVGVPRHANAACRFRDGLPEGVLEITVTRTPPFHPTFVQIDNGDYPVCYLFQIARAP